MSESDEEIAQMIFEEYFFRDLEKWFSAGIACCDTCYDSFIAKWPAAYWANDTSFQGNQIDFESFYSGSILRDRYSKDEFDRRVRLLLCPNCGECLTHNIWPFDLPFHCSEDDQRSLDELREVTLKTPFLTLRHPLAQRALEAIEGMARTQAEVLPPYPLYRGRILSGPGHFQPKDMLWPPNSVAKEGRYNHAGHPCLYMCTDKKTCWSELDRPSEGIVVASIRIQDSMKCLDLVEAMHEESEIQRLIWSVLMTAPAVGEGWDKPEYAFTRFVADCALYFGISILRYPSAVSGQGTNYVLLDPDRYVKGIRVESVEPYQPSKNSYPSK